MISWVLFTSSANAAEFADNSLLHYGGGGLMLEVLTFDQRQLNQILVENGFTPMKNRLSIYGGNFFSQTDNNFRYSFFGALGGVSTHTPGGKAAILSLSHLGVWLEQVIPLTKHFSLNGGLATSFGGMDLHLIHQSLDDYTEGFFRPQQTLINTLFLMAKPQLGLSYSLGRYFDLEVKVGYYYLQTLGGWRQGKEKVSGDQMLTSLSGVAYLLNLNFGF